LLDSFLLSWLVPCLPIEVTGRLSIVQECDVEKIIEVEYDQWVRHGSSVYFKLVSSR
jgi:hypothetical protein